MAGTGVVPAVLRGPIPTRTSWRHTHPRSRQLLSLWTWSIGFVFWRRRFGCSLWLTSRRFTLPHNSFWGLSMHGETFLMPCSLWTTVWLSKSLPLLSVSIIFLLVCWIGSCLSFWIWSKETWLWWSMWTSSTILHSMQKAIWTLMRRRETVSTTASLASCKGSYIQETIRPLVLWWILLLPWRDFSVTLRLSGSTSRGSLDLLVTLGLEGVGCQEDVLPLPRWTVVPTTSADTTGTTYLVPCTDSAGAVASGTWGSTSSGASSQA
jgi:hypothetical protein